MQHINYRYQILKKVELSAEYDTYVVKDHYDNRQYHATVIGTTQHNLVSLIKRNYRMLIQLPHDYINPLYRYEKIYFDDTKNSENRYVILETMPVGETLDEFCSKANTDDIGRYFRHLLVFISQLETIGIFITHLPNTSVMVKNGKPLLTNLTFWANSYETPLTVYHDIGTMLQTCVSDLSQGDKNLSELSETLLTLQTREDAVALVAPLIDHYGIPPFDSVPYSLGASADFEFVEKIVMHPPKIWGLIPITKATPITWLHHYTRQTETNDALYFSFMGSGGDMLFLEQLFSSITVYFPPDVVKKYQNILSFLSSDSIQFHLDRMTKIQLFESLARIFRVFANYYHSIILFIVEYDNLDILSRDFLLYLSQDEYVKSLRILTATTFSDNMLYDFKERSIDVEKLPIGFQLTKDTVRRIASYIRPGVGLTEGALSFIASHITNADETAHFISIADKKYGLLKQENGVLDYKASGGDSLLLSYTQEKQKELQEFFVTQSEPDRMNIILLSLLAFPKPVALLHNILPVQFIQSMVERNILFRDYNVYYLKVPFLRDSLTSFTTPEMLKDIIERFIRLMIPYKDKRLSDLPELFGLLFSVTDNKAIFEDLVADVVKHKYYSYEPRKYEMVFNQITEKIIEYELPFPITIDFLDLLERFGFTDHITRLVFYANSIAITAHEKVRTLLGIAEVFALEQNEKPADGYVEEAFKYIPELDAKSKTIALLHFNKVLQNVRRYDAIIDNSIVIISELWDNLSIIKKLELLTTLGNAYYKSGNIEDAQIQFEHAMTLIQKNINLVPLYIQSTVINNLGVIYSKMGKYDKAHANYKHAIALYQNFSDIYGLTTAYNNLAALSLKINPYDPIIYNYTMKGLSYARKTGTLPNIVLGYSSLISYYFNKNYLYKIEEMLTDEIPGIIANVSRSDNYDEYMTLLTSIINFQLTIGDFKGAKENIDEIHRLIDINPLIQNKHIAEINTFKYLFEMGNYQLLLDEWTVISEKYTKPTIADRVIIDIFYFTFLAALIVKNFDLVSDLQYILRTHYTDYFTLPYYEKKFQFMLSIKKFDFREISFAMLQYTFSSTESNKQYELIMLSELAFLEDNLDYAKELSCEMLLYQDFIKSNITEEHAQLLTAKPHNLKAANFLSKIFSLPEPTLTALKRSLSQYYLEKIYQTGPKQSWEFIGMILNFENDHESLCNYIVQRFEAFRVVIYGITTKHQLNQLFSMKKKPYYSENEEIDEDVVNRALQTGDIVFRDLTENFTCLYTNAIKYSVAIPIIDIERVEMETQYKRRRSDNLNKNRKFPSKILYFDTKRFISPIPFYAHIHFSGLQEIISLYNHYSLIKRNALLCQSSGVYNFYYWHLLLAKTLAEEQIEHEASLIVIVEILNYREIVSVYGSDIDKQFLKQLASVLEGIVRKDDMIGKHSRHSFIMNLVIPKGTNPEDILKRIKKAIDEHDFTALTFHVKTAIGGSLFPDQGVSTAALIENAETALNEARKESGHCLIWDKNMKRIANSSPLPISIDKLYTQSSSVFGLINNSVQQAEALRDAATDVLTECLPFSGLYVKIKNSDIKIGDSLLIDNVLATNKDGLFYYQDSHYIVQFGDDNSHIILISEREITLDDYYILKSIYEVVKMKIATLED